MQAYKKIEIIKKKRTKNLTINYINDNIYIKGFYNRGVEYYHIFLDEVSKVSNKNIISVYNKYNSTVHLYTYTHSKFVFYLKTKKEIYTS